MNTLNTTSPLDFAEGLIRAPIVQKIADRTFQMAIGTAVAATGATLAVLETPALPVMQKAQTCAAFFGIWAVVAVAYMLGDKAKDAKIAAAAIAAHGGPNTVNAGGDVNLAAAPDPLPGPAASADLGTLGADALASLIGREIDKRLPALNAAVPRPSVPVDPPRPAIQRDVA